MNLQERIEILVSAGEIISGTDGTSKEEWSAALETAYRKNNWFAPLFLQKATEQISSSYLKKEKLEAMVSHYFLDEPASVKTVGIVMAGNIPLVGFHDFLCVFLSGHHQRIKLSSKDDVLLPTLIRLLERRCSAIKEYVSITERLNDCDAYIATGSDNSARYFEYYFGRYPSVIRKNRTSVAVLTGNETNEELSLLADDLFIYFGLGCRNVTQIHVPKGYNFQPLLESMKKYSWCFDHNKYRNNYDYQLAIYIMNSLPYMTNDCIVLIENESPFSPVGTLHYFYYDDLNSRVDTLKTNQSIQAIVGYNGVPFGQAQTPGLMDYADGVDTMAFLLTL
jgi:hypothetical protein